MWFAASLLFRSSHQPETCRAPLWEEQIILIQADSEQAAMERAKEIGNNTLSSYKNIQGERVEWRFQRVERVYSIQAEELQEGVEIFSRFLRDREVQSLLTPFGEDEP